MGTNSMIIDAAALAKLERKYLEADWRRAWESCAHAAQVGNYAEAERWHRKATLLGEYLGAVDHTLAAMGQPLARV